MAQQPINLSGTVISITSGGGRGRRRSRNLLVVQGPAEPKNSSQISQGSLKKKQRVYRIRCYDPEQYSIGSAINFRDIQKKMGGYWEAEDINYNPNSRNHNPGLRVIRGGGSSGLENKLSSHQGSSAGFVNPFESEELPYQRKKYMNARASELELPQEIRQSAMLGIDRLIGFIKREYTHNMVYGDYENPRPANDPVKNELSAYVDQKDARTGYANSVAVYRALIAVVTGKSLGPARSDGVADSYDLKQAKGILKNSIARITEEQLEKLERWADRQRR